MRKIILNFQLSILNKCAMITVEVNTMEDFNPELEQDEYIPRPRWQVWGARIAVIFVLAAAALYYWSIANPF